eukprot:9467968-Pyramimonas_sp.AAC.1
MACHVGDIGRPFARQVANVTCDPLYHRSSYPSNPRLVVCNYPLFFENRIFCNPVTKLDGWVRVVNDVRVRREVRAG